MTRHPPDDSFLPSTTALIDAPQLSSIALLEVLPSAPAPRPRTPRQQHRLPVRPARRSPANLVASLLAQIISDRCRDLSILAAAYRTALGLSLPRSTTKGGSLPDGRPRRLPSPIPTSTRDDHPGQRGTYCSRLVDHQERTVVVPGRAELVGDPPFAGADGNSLWILIAAYLPVPGYSLCSAGSSAGRPCSNPRCASRDDHGECLAAAWAEPAQPQSLARADRSGAVPEDG